VTRNWEIVDWDNGDIQLRWIPTQDRLLPDLFDFGEGKDACRAIRGESPSTVDLTALGGLSIYGMKVIVDMALL